MPIFETAGLITSLNDIFHFMVQKCLVHFCIVLVVGILVVHNKLKL